MDSGKYLIDTVIAQTKDYNSALLCSYELALNEYPRGSIVIKEQRGRKYCYFQYRDGKRVITKYAGTEARLAEFQQLVAAREKIHEEIKQIRDELKRIERMEEAVK